MHHRTNGLALLLIPFVALFSFFLGLTFINTIGPLTFPDASRHVYEIVALATGQEFKPASPYTDEFGNKFSVQYVALDTRIYRAPSNGGTIISSLIQLPESNDPLFVEQHSALSAHPNSATSQIVRRTAHSHFLSYLVPGSVYAFFSACGSSPWRGFQAGRLANLLIHIVVVCYALYMLPRGKALLSFIATLPTTVFMASSLSSDAMLFASVSLCIAIACHALYKGHMTTPEAVICAAASVFAFINKAPYGVIAITLLALPAQVLSINSKIKVSAIALAVAFCLWLPWRFSVSSVACIVNLDSNYAWVAQHPLQMFYRVIASACDIPYRIYAAPSRYAIESVVVLVALLSAICEEHQDAQSTIGNILKEWRMPLIGFVVGFCAVAATFLLLGITWNDLATTSLWLPLTGFQERYLVPLLPLSLLVYYPASVTGRSRATRTIGQSDVMERDSLGED